MLTLGSSMVLWGVGAAIIGTTPSAYVADSTDSEARPQALALLRTGGDFGLMMGALSSGIIADATSVETAFHLKAMLFATVLARFHLGATEPVVAKHKE